MNYAILSDLHCHKWSTFSRTDTDGVNSRLRIILDEAERAADALLAAGGKVMAIAGDIFHVRGSLDPEVLNPTQETFRRILDKGVDILFIPGNHDLTGTDTTELGSAVQTLAETFSAAGTIRAFNKPTLLRGAVSADAHLAFVPWFNKTEDLLAAAATLAAEALKDGILSKTDLIIHAGIDGAIDNMPAHGLTPGRLAALGFRRVFAGHYHNHRDLGGGVFSIGATTHQKWTDLGTKAGFLLVDDAKVTYNATHAPSFVDVTGMSEADMEIAAAGNYVRFRGDKMTNSQVQELRDFFTKAGALGVTLQVVKDTGAARATTPTRTGMSLADSVAGFVDTSKDVPDPVREVVKKQCADILAKVSSVVEEA